MDPEQTRGLRAAVVAYTLWGLLTIYWKQLSGLPPFELIGWRIAMAAIVMAVVTTATGRWEAVGGALRDPRMRLRVGAAGTLLTVNWTTYVWAVVNDRVIETALGYFLAPLGTMAVGVFLLGERMTALKRVSVVLTVVAVVVLTVSYGRLPWVAVVVAASWSTYVYIKRGVALGATESFAAEVLVLLGPACVIVAVGFARSDGLPHLAHGADWPLLAGTGIVTAIPLVLFAYAAPRVPFTVLGPANFLVPIINFLLGWLVFGEALPPVRVAGFALVWLALAAVTVDTVRGRPRVAAPRAVPIR